jgi:hypothetical protein
VRIQLDWRAAKAVDVQVATQIVAHLASPVGGRPDGLYLIVGDAPPPLILGEDDETRQAELATYEGKLPVAVHGRYFVTRARLGEFIEVLQRAATLYDEASEGGTA